MESADARLVKFGFKLGQVLQRDQAAVGRVEVGDLLRDGAFVEEVMHGCELFDAIAFGLLLGCDHLAEGVGQLGQTVEIAGAGRFAALHEEVARCGPVSEDAGGVVNVGGEHLRDRESIGVFDGGLGHLRKGHRAVFGQRGKNSARNTRKDGGADAFPGDRNSGASGALPRFDRARAVIFRGRFCRCRADAAQHTGGLVLQLDNDGNFAAEAEVILLGNRRREDGRHAGVDGVAALLQDAIAGFHLEVIGRAHHFTRAAHGREHGVLRLSGDGAGE